MRGNIQIAVHWLARITSLILWALVIVFAVGEGLPNPFQQPAPVQMEFLAMFLMLAGFLLGWGWEPLGGMVVVSGFVVFLFTELIVNRQPPGGAISLLLVPGVLFLLSYGLRVRPARKIGVHLV